MKAKKKFFVLLLGLCTTVSYAQEAASASGGEASGSGGTVSYTVGQVLYNTYTSASNSEAQGVQQPYEISIVLGIEDQKGISLYCNAFPNPSTTYLQLEVENYSLKDLRYQLFDIAGKLLTSQSILSTTTTINMADYVPASYLLHVVSDTKTIQTFKIIKNEN